MIIAVILAGGIGSRVGAARPKQFIEIDGKPIISYTIEHFQAHKEIDTIAVVCHKEWQSYLKSSIESENYSKVKWIFEGGDTFQMSVLNAVNGLSQKISPDDIVLVHFGASPYVSEDIISDCIRVCKEKGNAISTTPFYLLPSIVDPSCPDRSKSHINRDEIAVMNSPHAFKYQLLCDIYETGISSGAINKVEPHTTTLMQYLGIPIFFSKGAQTNIKITTKEDLDLYEAYVYYKKHHS